MRVASQRPMPAGRTSKVTAVPELDGSGPVEQGRAVERKRPAVRLDGAEPAWLVEGDDLTVHQWTILARGTSMMSLAPASLRAGMRVLMVSFATTVSTA